MTIVQSVSAQCSVCATSSVFRFMASTSTFGSYDLDLRAPPLKRHTMGVWLQDCPECGYTNYSVEDLIPGAPPGSFLQGVGTCGIKYDSYRPGA